MNYLKNFLFILFILFALSKPVFAELPVYLDFKFILNNSTAGKKAQDSLKKKLDSGIKSLNSKEKSIQEEERKIIRQKKILAFFFEQDRSCSDAPTAGSLPYAKSAVCTGGGEEERSLINRS